MGKAKKGRRRPTGSAVSVPRALKRQTANRFIKPEFSSDAIKAQWNPRRSARQNLASFGLAFNANVAIIHGQPTLGNLASGEHAAKNKPVEFAQVFQAPEGDDRSRHLCGDINEKRRAMPQLEVDQKYASKLLAKHGTDYKVGLRASW